MIGGEGGIRTLGTVAHTTVFETVPFDRSGTSPELLKTERFFRQNKCFCQLHSVNLSFVFQMRKGGEQRKFGKKGTYPINWKR
jgi:hypothetical protein